MNRLWLRILQFGSSVMVTGTGLVSTIVWSYRTWSLKGARYTFIQWILTFKIISSSFTVNMFSSTVDLHINWILYTGSICLGGFSVCPGALSFTSPRVSWYFPRLFPPQGSWIQWSDAALGRSWFALPCSNSFQEQEQESGQIKGLHL